jgi:hypothetical protein
MPTKHPLGHYVPIAFVIAVALAAFFVANPGFIFKVLDPAASIEKHQQQTLRSIASADAALTADEARQLFARYQSGEYAAGSALVGQDHKHGLPAEFLNYLEGQLIESGKPQRYAAQLIEQLAIERPFDVNVEQAVAAMVRTPRGGTNTQPISTLGNIGSKRALSEPTLTLLLEVALNRTSAARTALATLEKTAHAFGLPDWALDRLEEICNQRPGAIRTDAIKVIAAAGAQDRALALLNSPKTTRMDTEAITQTLRNDELEQLVDRLHNDTQVIEVRIGALNQIVHRRDRSELVGPALAYAFTHEEDALRLAAFVTYSERGRHHTRFIDVNWSEVCARAFDDDNESIRIRSASAFRFVSFADNQARDRFLLQMLAGTDNQQLTALRAASQTRLLSEPVNQAIGSLVTSPIEAVASTAFMLSERTRPKGRFEGLGSWLIGAALFALLGLPAITALGFQTYFVARLLQNMAVNAPRTGATLISLAWLILSVALGLTLFAGVLGMGHGGVGAEEVIPILLVINLVFFGVGWLLRWTVKPRVSTEPVAE